MTADLDFDGFDAEVIAHRLVLTFLAEDTQTALDAWSDIADAEDLSESSWREVAAHLTCLAAAHLCNEVGHDDARTAHRRTDRRATARRTRPTMTDAYAGPNGLVFAGFHALKDVGAVPGDTARQIIGAVTSTHF